MITFVRFKKNSTNYRKKKPKKKISENKTHTQKTGNTKTLCYVPAGNKAGSLLLDFLQCYMAFAGNSLSLSLSVNMYYQDCRLIGGIRMWHVHECIVVVIAATGRSSCYSYNRTVRNIVSIEMFLKDVRSVTRFAERYWGNGPRGMSNGEYSRGYSSY